MIFFLKKRCKPLVRVLDICLIPSLHALLCFVHQKPQQHPKTPASACKTSSRTLGGRETGLGKTVDGTRGEGVRSILLLEGEVGWRACASRERERERGREDSKSGLRFHRPPLPLPCLFVPRVFRLPYPCLAFAKSKQLRRN